MAWFRCAPASRRISTAFRVRGLRFWVWVLGLKVQGFGSRSKVQGLGLWVWGLGFKVWGFGLGGPMKNIRELLGVVRGG